MESKVADMLDCNYRPIAFIKTDERPEDAIGPKSGGGFGCVMPYINTQSHTVLTNPHHCFGCVMPYINRTIMKRIPSVFKKDTLSLPKFNYRIRLWKQIC